MYIVRFLNLKLKLSAKFWPIKPFLTNEINFQSLSHFQQDKYIHTGGQK